MDFLDIKATLKDLKAVITDPNLCLVFRGFLKEILGGENLSFVVEVQGYKEILSPDLRKIRAKEIWEKYCTPLSNYEINIEAYARDSVKSKLDDAPQLLFQELEDAVTQILLQDSFPKFLGSEQFKQYVEHTRKEEAARQNAEIAMPISTKKPNKKDKEKYGVGAKKAEAKTQLIPSTAPVRHHHGSIVMYTNYLADKLTIQESKELQKIIDKLAGFTEKQSTIIDMTNTKDMNTFFKSGNQFGQLWPNSMQRLILKNCGLDSFPNLEGLSENQLVELNLSRNRIPSVPLMLNNLASVTSLNLSENLLTALPAQISQLVSLKELNLERNLLSSLPTQISELTNLEILTLPFNLLTEFPKELYKLANLQLLLLDSNRIKAISDEISQMTSLRFLSMVELPDIVIPPAIVNCKNLKELVHTPSQTFVVPANIAEYGNETVVRYFFLLRSLKVTNLQFKSHWKPDILFKSCKVCGAAFNYVNRRHHCRLCGLIVDSKCLIATKKPQPRLGFDKPIKICTACQAALTDLEQELIAKSEQGEFDMNSTPPLTQRQLILQAQNNSRENSNTNSANTSATSSNASSTTNSNASSPRIVPMSHSDPSIALRDALGSIAKDVVTRVQRDRPNQFKQYSSPNLHRENDTSVGLPITRNKSQQLNPNQGTLQTSLSAPAVNTISFEITSNPNSPPNNLNNMASPGTSPSNRVIFKSSVSSPRAVTAPTSSNSSIEVETTTTASTSNEFPSGSAKGWRVIMPTSKPTNNNNQVKDTSVSSNDNEEESTRRSDSPTVYNYILEKGVPTANESYK